MLFISFNKREYRRALYAEKGIPKKKFERIEAMRTAQFSRLAREFEGSAMGKLLLRRISNIEHSFVSVAKRRNPARQQKNIDAALALLQKGLAVARINYLEALHGFAVKRKAFQSVVGEISAKLKAARQA